MLHIKASILISGLSLIRITSCTLLLPLPLPLPQQAGPGGGWGEVSGQTPSLEAWISEASLSLCEPTTNPQSRLRQLR